MAFIYLLSQNILCLLGKIFPFFENSFSCWNTFNYQVKYTRRLQKHTYIFDAQIILSFRDRYSFIS
jgi:hypothetical protein